MTRSAQGEDRSGFQAEASWRGNSFGICKATEGLTFVDPTFAANWARLRAELKPRGAYHFFHPGLDPVAQARFFVATVKAAGLRPPDMLVADIEITAGADGTLALADEHAAGRSHVPVTGTLISAGLGIDVGARRFLDEVRALAGPHHPVLVYTNLTVGRLLGACAGSYDLWIALPGAAAPASVAPWKIWRVWQWQFGGGPGGGDRDAFNGDRREMHRWLASYRPRKHPQVQAQMADGKTTLAEVAAAHKVPPSTILRLTAEHGQANGEFTVPVAVWLNSVFGGLAPATDPVPEGTTLIVPA